MAVKDNAGRFNDKYIKGNRSGYKGDRSKYKEENPLEVQHPITDNNGLVIFRNNSVKTSTVSNLSHKTFTFTTASEDPITVVQYNSASVDGSINKYYNQLNSAYYYTNFPIDTYCSSNAYTASVPCRYGNYDVDAHLNPNPQYRHKFNKKGTIYSIPKKYYGEHIKEGSVKLTETLDGKPHIVKDDGYGNLYRHSDTPINMAYYNNDISGSPSSSISSSENYIGNVFYDLGLITVTETASFWTGSGTNYTLQFDSSVDTITREYTCNLKKHEWNFTYNNTILETAPTVVTYRDFEQNLSRSIDIIEDSKIGSEYLNNRFSPYVTSIGLFNRRGDLLMVASFPEPIKKSKIKDMIFKIRMDF